MIKKKVKMYGIDFLVFHEEGSNIIVAKPEHGYYTDQYCGASVRIRDIVRKAKCNPNDIFNFNRGASIAITRCLTEILGRYNTAIVQKVLDSSDRFAQFIEKNKLRNMTEITPKVKEE